MQYRLFPIGASLNLSPPVDLALDNSHHFRSSPNATIEDQIMDFGVVINVLANKLCIYSYTHEFLNDFYVL